MLKNKRHKATQLKGLLVYWSIGLLVYWSIGLLVYWFIGLLVYWSIGKDSYAVLSNVVTSLEGL
jgi:hypothetical protein